MRSALRRGAVRGALLALLVLSASAASAEAASVAYVDQGSVWLASLDGAQKVKLAGPVVNGSGETEEWLDVAQSDGGRIVAVRNKPGRISSFSWFKIWEPDGTSTVEGPLNAKPGWTQYVYPLGFDITADGRFLAYGFLNSTLCCPITYSRGTYVRPATSGTVEPIVVSAQYPALAGRRIVGLEGGASPNVLQVQNADAGNPFTDAFTGWMDTTPVGLEPGGVDVSSSGSVAAIDFEAWTGGTQTTGKIAVISTSGLDAPVPFPAAVDCFVPVQGVARESSLAPDGSSIAWSDDGGVKVAGTPTTAADPCVMSSPTATIAPTGRYPSIGGASMSAFLPAAAAPPAAGPAPAAPPRPVTAPRPGGTSTATRAPVVTLPAKVTLKTLRASAGLPITVRVSGPGRVSVRATVPARRLGRRGKPVVVATGSATARRAGALTVRLKLNALGRKRAKRLKGARVTLKITQGTRTTTKTTTVR